MPKLNCREAQNLLEAFHDNELDGVNSLLAQEHLDECPDCRRQWRWLCEVEASLNRLSESPPSATQDLRRRVLQPTSTQPSLVVAFFSNAQANDWSGLASGAVCVGRRRSVNGMDQGRRHAVCAGFDEDDGERRPG